MKDKNSTSRVQTVHGGQHKQRVRYPSNANELVNSRQKRSEGQEWGRNESKDVREDEVKLGQRGWGSGASYEN
jgi:hypothetical protein